VREITKKYKEEVLDKYGINIDSSYSLAKKIVNIYTNVDEEGYLNICWAGKCDITDVWVDKDFLIDELNYNWNKLARDNGLYDPFLDLMVEELGFDYDFSLIVFINFILPEIYEVYFKPLEPDYINESMNRNKKYEITKEDLKKLLYHYTVDMGFDKESAIEDLKDLIRWFNSLPNKIKLYRLLYLNDENEINYDELGSHYSNNKIDLINNHYNRGSIYGDMGEEVFLITVEASKDKIDFIETLTNNILFPNEQEITLEDKGRGVDFIKVEKL